MFENISLAFQGIWGHKMRSFLTMLGIIIGIASIITIVSTIQGTNELIKQNLVGSGTNAVKIQLYQNDNPYDTEYSSIPDGIASISEETRKSLEDLGGIDEASVYHSRTYTDGIYYQNIAFSGNLYGIDSHYLNIYNYSISYGRDFISSDYSAGKKVAILDSVAVSSLFSGENPIGKTIEINTEPFVIVGVVSQHSTFKPTISSLSDYYTYANSTSGNIFIPDKAWPVVYRYDEPQSVVIRASSTDEMTTAGKNAEDALTSSQVLAANSTFSYKSEDLLGKAKDLQDLSSSTNKQLIWIASISLLVGGIGVMNIMLVSVTERTSEIGLKKAIGAKKKKILWQFLTEAASLTSLGGVIGVLVGIGLAYMMSSITLAPTAISIPAIIIAVVFSMLIGIVFGLLPAFKASNLNPIDALRRE